MIVCFVQREGSLLHQQSLQKIKGVPILPIAESFVHTLNYALPKQYDLLRNCSVIQKIGRNEEENGDLS